MEPKEKNKTQDLEEELSPSELRRIISGEMEFSLQINKDVEVTLKELSQSELEEIDNTLEKRGILITGSPNTYTNAVNVLKLSKSLISATVRGKTYPINTQKDIEKLLKGLGEGVITGLIMNYENEISKKFSQIKKKGQ